MRVVEGGGATSKASAELDTLLSEGASLSIQLEVRNDGRLRYFYADGTPMTDAEARVLRRHAASTLREQLEAHCQRLNEDLDRWVDSTSRHRPLM